MNMKTYQILILFLLLANKSFPKSDDSLLDYYPLAIGNYWEYAEIEFSRLKDSTTFLQKFSVEVVGDTIWSNGKKYQKLLKKILNTPFESEIVYERIDSTTFNIYRIVQEGYIEKNSEVMIDSLRNNTPEGYYAGYSRNQLIPASVQFIGNEQDTAFSDTFQLKHFSAEDQATLPPFEYWLAENLGLMRTLINETTFYKETLLEYAQIDDKKYGSRTHVIQRNSIINNFSLSQNFPNPFNTSTRISYSLKKSGLIELVIFNIVGQKVKTVFKGFQPMGNYTFNFDAADYKSGVYVYQLRMNNQYINRKLLLLK